MCFNTSADFHHHKKIVFILQMFPSSSNDFNLFLESRQLLIPSHCYSVRHFVYIKQNPSTGMAFHVLWCPFIFRWHYFAQFCIRFVLYNSISIAHTQKHTMASAFSLLSVHCIICLPRILIRNYKTDEHIQLQQKKN